MNTSESTRMKWLLGIAWLGGWIHDLHFTPGTLGLGAAVIPWLLLTVLLYWLWKWTEGSAGVLAALFVYGMVALLGAIFTVLPLGFLPFEPEQTLGHYLVHTIYAVAQIPLLVFLVIRFSGVHQRHRTSS